MTKFLLFTGKNCSKCPQMKANLLRARIAFDEVSTDTKTGMMMSGVMHVRSLPTLVVTLHGKPIHSFVGCLPIEKIEDIKKKYHK